MTNQSSMSLRQKRKGKMWAKEGKWKQHTFFNRYISRIGNILWTIVSFKPFKDICLYICVCVCIYMCVCVYVYIYMYTCMCVYIYKCKYICVCNCILYIYISLSLSIPIYLSIYLYLHPSIYLSIYLSNISVKERLWFTVYP